MVEADGDFASEDGRQVKAEGNALYGKKQYPEAIEKYKSAMGVFLGPDFTLPTKDYFNERYLQFGNVSADQRDFVELVACAGNIAQCYAKLYEASGSIDDLLPVFAAIITRF